MLLEREGVNPDKPNYAGQTPLSYAAWQGHEGVVKILLEREEVNPKKADNEGLTPLIHAARHDHQKVIELLELHEAVTYGTLLDIGDTPREMTAAPRLSKTPSSPKLSLCWITYSGFN